MPSDSPIEHLLDSLCGINEVAELLDVTPNQVSVWAYRNKLPIPDVLLNNGKTAIWIRENILSWASDTGRLPADVTINFRRR
tara:strand:+ start:989 stop:1234 length:246 start_codon:yes stop_codon:yes gene_type:complete